MFNNRPRPRRKSRERVLIEAQRLIQKSQAMYWGNLKYWLKERYAITNDDWEWIWKQLQSSPKYEVVGGSIYLANSTLLKERKERERPRKK